MAYHAPIPSWARWIAQDEDGTWWAYEHEPNQNDTGWYENEVGRYHRLQQESPNSNWKQCLHKLTTGKMSGC